MEQQEAFDFPDESKDAPRTEPTRPGPRDAAGDQHLPLLWRAHAVGAARQHPCRRG